METTNQAQQRQSIQSTLQTILSPFCGNCDTFDSNMEVSSVTPSLRVLSLRSRQVAHVQEVGIALSTMVFGARSLIDSYD